MGSRLHIKRSASNALLSLGAGMLMSFSGLLSGQCLQTPAIPTATPASVQCGQTAVLTASGSTGDYRWYNVASGGTVLGTGAVFTTPVLFASNQVFYVEAFDVADPTCASGRVAVQVSTISNVVSPTAAGASFFCGGSATLTASGSTGIYRWHTAATGGSLVGSSASYTTPNLANSQTFYLEALESNDDFSASYTSPGTYTFVVPQGASQIVVDVWGGRGGTQCDGGIPGNGGRVQAVLSVTPGESLQVNVGGAGTNGVCSWSFSSGGFNGGGSGYRGGGGGGASDIRRGGTGIGNRVVVAGGGGGGGWGCGGMQDRGGNGGGLIAESGWRCNSVHSQSCSSAGPGTQTTFGTNCNIGTPGNGSSSTGGNASNSTGSSGHGGGGSGWFGGAGGWSGGGGGGGSSYTAPGVTNVVHTQGFNSGAGRVDILCFVPVCRSPRVPIVVDVNSFPAPPVTVSSTLCGANPVLTASAAPGNFYEWYSDAALTQLIGTTSSITLPPLVNNDTVYVRTYSAGQQTFSYTGNVQSFTVPDGISEVQVDVFGAQGGSQNTSNRGGFGGRVQTSLTVTPGDVLNVYVGQQPTTNSGGWNGGGLSGTSLSSARGGGGASDIRLNGTELSDRVVVAGGGGGNGSNCGGAGEIGGAGGGPATAENGRQCDNLNSTLSGRGGTQTAGGQNAPTCSNTLPFAGSFGQGGQGNCSNQTSGGGGGGGWYGGGGGANGGGGGGSSYVDPALTSNTLHEQGVRSGNGTVTISYRFCLSPVTAVPLTVTPVSITSVIGDTVSCGGAAQLTAVSNGGPVSWFTSQAATTPAFQGSAASFFVQNQPVTYWVETSNTGFRTDSIVFNFTGSTQTWTVPAGLSSVIIEAYGAQGGSNSHSQGGLGGRTRATMSVTPGELLRINVGGTTANNNGGWNGGGLSGTSFSVASARGGGGASDVRSGGTELGNRILVAGGGGGAGQNCNSTNSERGGNGGGPATAQDGTTCSTLSGAWAGRGGTQTTGGANTPNCGSGVPFAGSLGQGGQGNCTNNTSGGGGGGGHFGGGGGGNGGGGGGSSFVDAMRGSTISHSQGANSGAGRVVIYFEVPVTCTSTRVPVVAEIDSLPAPSVSPDALGCAPVTSTFIASGGLPSYEWFTVASGNTPIATGSTLIETSSDTISFFVGYKDTLGCPSKRAAVSILPTPLPNAGLVAGANSFCQNAGIVSLQAITPGGTGLINGVVSTNQGAFDVALLPIGISTVDYQVTANGCTNTATSTIEVLASPVATIASSPVAICENATAVTLSAPGTGVWSGNGVNMLGVVDPALIGVGNFMAYYSVTASNGCSAMDSISVVVNALPNASITNPSPIVCTSSLPVNLTAATAGGTWSGTGVNSSTGQFSPGQAGQGTFSIDYSVSANGCTSIASTQIQVQSGPNPAITTPPSAVCVNANPLQLQALTSGGTWSGSGISNPNAGVFNPALAGTGNNTVFYSIVQGPCTSVDSVVFVVNPAPVAAVSPGSAQTICEGSNVTFTASGGTSYQWALNGQPIAGATNAAFSATLPGLYNVQVSDVNACSANSGSVNLNVNAKPVINAVQVPAVCQGQNSQFNSNVSVVTTGGAIVTGYAWDFGVAGTSLAFQPSVQFPSAGSFPVTLIVGTNQNCSDTINATAVVNPNPVLSNVTATNACVGGLTQFSANATVASVNNAQIVNQSWNFGTQTLSGQTATQQYNAPGIYGYTFTATTNHGCSGSVNNSVQVYAAPVALFTAADGCEGNAIPFGDLSSSNVTSWAWNFGDGNSAAVASPTHTYQTPGSFIPSLTVSTAEGCSASFSMTLQVAPTPQANFSETPLGGLTYQFSPTSPIPGASYVWTFGDGTASTDLAPSKTYVNPGVYNVCLSVSRGNCTSSICEQVNITNVAGMDESGVFSAMVYPNPFTSYFQVDFALSGPEEVTVQLYDLSGKLILNRSEGQLGSGSHSLLIQDEVSSLPAGTYLLQLTTGVESRMFRLVHIAH